MYRLEWVRKQHELTQRELAHDIGVTHSTISNWETGRSYPTAHSRYLLSRRLGIRDSQLFERVDFQDEETKCMYPQDQDAHSQNQKPQEVPPALSHIEIRMDSQEFHELLGCFVRVFMAAIHLSDPEKQKEIKTAAVRGMNLLCSKV